MEIREFVESDSFHDFLTLLLFLFVGLLLYLVTGLTGFIIAGCVPGIIVYITGAYRYIQSVVETYW